MGENDGWNWYYKESSQPYTWVSWARMIAINAATAFAEYFGEEATRCWSVFPTLTSVGCWKEGHGHNTAIGFMFGYVWHIEWTWKHVMAPKCKFSKCPAVCFRTYVSPNLCFFSHTVYMIFLKLYDICYVWKGSYWKILTLGASGYGPHISSISVSPHPIN